MRTTKFLKCLVILLTICSSTIAQDYSISAGVLSSFEASSQSFRFSTFTSRIFFEDFYVETIQESTSSNTITYTPEIGFYVNLYHHIPISKNLTLNTGIGINKFALSSTSSIQQFQSNIISQDTIFESIEPTIFSSTCDIFTNSISDFSPQQGIDIDLLYLTVPLHLQYAVTPKYGLRAGAIFKTPIYTQSIQEIISLFTEELDNITECTYVLQQQNNTSGGDYNNIGLDLYLGAIFKPVDYLSIDLSITSSTQNLFHHGLTTQGFNELGNFKPIQIGLGMSCFINRSNSKSESIEP
jgi:hypothetical protein